MKSAPISCLLGHKPTRLIALTTQGSRGLAVQLDLAEAQLHLRGLKQDANGRGPSTLLTANHIHQVPDRRRRKWRGRAAQSGDTRPPTRGDRARSSDLLQFSVYDALCASQSSPGTGSALTSRTKRSRF